MCLGDIRAHGNGIGQAKLHKLDTYYHQRTEEDRLMPLRNLEERMAKFQVTPRRQSVSICTGTRRLLKPTIKRRCGRCDAAARQRTQCGGAPLSTPRASLVYVMQCGNAVTNGRRGAVQTAA